MCKPRGFTIIELLIVIGVIGIISTLVTISFTSTKRGMVFEQSKDYISADVARVITWAQSGKVDITTGSRVVPSGYGIVFWEPSVGKGDYYIFADDPITSDRTFTPADTIIEEVDLSEAMTLSQVFVDDVFLESCSPHPAGVGSPPPFCTLYVDLPSGDLHVDSPAQNDVVLILENANTGAQMQMTINIHTGQIEYQEL